MMVSTLIGLLSAIFAPATLRLETEVGRRECGWPARFILKIHYLNIWIFDQILLNSIWSNILDWKCDHLKTSNASDNDEGGGGGAKERSFFRQLERHLWAWCPGILVFWQSNPKMLMKKCVRAVRAKSNEWLLVLRTFWFHPFCKIRKKETPGILCGFVQRIDWLLTKQCLVGQTHIWGKGGPAASEVYIVFLCIWSLHSFTEYIVDAWMVLTAHSPRDNVRNLWTLG